VRAEKVEKACYILKDYLSLNMNTDQIIEILKEKEIE
jgi:hypothetical protein